MIELQLIIISAVAVFASGVINGVTGFGFVIVAAPILTSYLDPTLVVPVMILQTLVLGLILLSQTFRDTNLRRVWPLMLVGAAFTPVGTLLLVILDESALKVLMGVVVGVTATGMLLGLRRSLGNERVASIPVGFASGILTGSTGLSGAPVILFFSNQGIDPRQFRANIVAYLYVIGVVALPSFLVGGVLTRDVWVLAAQLLPASVCGVLAGMWLSPRVSTAIFRRMALAVVLVAAGGAIASGIADL